MIQHINSMITSAAQNIELSNNELADGHDVTDGVLDHLAEIKAAVTQIATLTGQVEADVASLCTRGGEVKEYMISATTSLGAAFGGPGVTDLMQQAMHASRQVKGVIGTLESVRVFMAARPEKFFETFQGALEALTSSTGNVRKDLQTAQESNQDAIAEIKKYSKKV